MNYGPPAAEYLLQMRWTEPAGNLLAEREPPRLPIGKTSCTLAAMDMNDRKFFEHPATPSAGSKPTLVRVYCCPCCELPTLSEPAGYEICDICGWEDDGGDGYGPNATSLDEAREHFRQYLTSYGPTHEISPQFRRDGIAFVHQLELTPGNVNAKRLRIAALQQYMAESDPRRRGELRLAAQS